jgi:hypothetical protein
MTTQAKMTCKRCKGLGFLADANGMPDGNLPMQGRCYNCLGTGIHTPKARDFLAGCTVKRGDKIGKFINPAAGTVEEYSSNLARQLEKDGMGLELVSVKEVTKEQAEAYRKRYGFGILWCDASGKPLPKD